MFLLRYLHPQLTPAILLGLKFPALYPFADGAFRDPEFLGGLFDPDALGLALAVPFGFGFILTLFPVFTGGYDLLTGFLDAVAVPFKPLNLGYLVAVP